MGVIPAFPGPQQDSQQEDLPPEPFVVEATITLEDRVAGAQFIYRDLFVGARRQMAMVVIWLLIVALLFVGYQAWEAAGRDGVQAVVTRFLSDLIGLAGLPILAIAALAFLRYLTLPLTIRSRLRRWYRDEKLDLPMTGTHRFEAGGIVSTFVHQTSAIACRRLAGLAEAANHIFVRIKDVEDAIVLSKQKLASDGLAKLRLWAASCHVEGVGAARSFPALESDQNHAPALTVRYVPTEADRVVGLTWQQERPGMRRRRWRGFAMAYVIAALLPFAALVLLWLLDSQRVPFRYAAPLLANMFVSDLWKWILGFWAIITLVLILHPWMRRSHARGISRQLHQKLRYYETEMRLSDDHLSVLQDGLTNRFNWRAFDRLERKGEHFLLSVRTGEPLIVPIRALEGDRVALFERFVAARIGETSKTEILA